MNIPLIDRVLEQIDSKPDTWNQLSWHCGTSHCVAGWVVTFDGWEPATDYPFEEEITKVVDGQKVVDFTRTKAAELLDISEEQADALFDAYNSRQDVEDMLDAIRQGAL